MWLLVYIKVAAIYVQLAFVATIFHQYIWMFTHCQAVFSLIDEIGCKSSCDWKHIVDYYHTNPD